MQPEEGISPSLSFFLHAQAIERRDLYLERKLPRISEETILFSTNDYLGLASHKDVHQAAIDSIKKEGVGGKSARLISGNRSTHEALEEAWAKWKGTEAALHFPTGYAAACGVIPAMIEPADYVVLDRYSHACLIDGAKISGATMRVFHHNDLDHLEEILSHIRSHDSGGHILIVVESLYSMDGDIAPLKEIIKLKNNYNAWLMVDEAHASGVFGPKGSGLCAEQEVSESIEIQMGTLGKSLGVSGGMIAGSQLLINHFINKARSFLFTTAAPAHLSSGTLKAVELAQGKEGNEARDRLFANLTSYFELMDLPLPNVLSPIIPIMIRDEYSAIDYSEALLEKGYHVPAIRFPTVPKGTARLRVSMTAKHTDDEIQGLTESLKDLDL